MPRANIYAGTAATSMGAVVLDASAGAGVPVPLASLLAPQGPSPVVVVVAVRHFA